MILLKRRIRLYIKAGDEDAMRRVSTLLVFFLALVCSHASAKSSNYVFTGKDMYESCLHALNGLGKTGEYDDHRFGVCAGYIAGIVDFHTVATTVELLDPDMFCLPRDIPRHRSFAMSHNTLRIIPENRMIWPLISSFPHFVKRIPVKRKRKNQANE